MGIAFRDASCIVFGMVNKPDSFEALLSLWSSPTELSEALGIPYVTAQVMRHRRSIGDRHWPNIIKAVAAKGVKLTTDDLLAMRFKRRAESGDRAA